METVIQSPNEEAPLAPVVVESLPQNPETNILADIPHDPSDAVTVKEKLIAQHPQLHANSLAQYPPYSQQMKMFLTTITEEIDNERIIGILREQNSKLTEQLHALNAQVTDILHKQARRVVSKQSVEQNSTDVAVMQKQLDNAFKRIEILTKQNKFFVSRIEKMSPEKLIQLESQIKEKDALIAKQSEEIKSRDATTKQMHKNANETKSLEQQTAKMEEQDRLIHQLNGEVRRLKSTLETQAKAVIRKQEYFVDVEQRYRECLEHLGINYSAHSVKNSLKDDLAQLKGNNNPKVRQPLTDMQTGSIALNQQKVQSHNHNSDALVRELQGVVKLKDKQIEVLKAQIVELRGISGTIQSSRPRRLVVSASQQQILSPIVRVNVKQSLPVIEKKEQPVVVAPAIHVVEGSNLIKKSVWGKQEGISKWMSDREILRDKLDVRIVKVAVWSNERAINGVQFIYKQVNSTSGRLEGPLIEGMQVLVDKNGQYNRSEWSGCQQSNLIDDQNHEDDLDDDDDDENDDYVQSVQCGISPQGCIDRLVFVSAKGKEFKVGSTARTERMLQNYDCQKGQSLVCAFAGLITFVDELQQESGGILACLGFDVLAKNEAGQQTDKRIKGFISFNLEKELRSNANNKYYQ